jgi:crotonobetaine/carnitine-CoA ligase
MGTWRDGVTSASASHMFRGLDVWQLLRLRVAASGDQTAFVWHPFVGAPRSWTYRQLERDVAHLAAGMANRGVQRGDKILIHLENCPEFVIAWYACAALGAVAVATNTRSSDPELRYFASHSGAVAAITQPKFFDRVCACAPEISWAVSTEHDSGVPAERHDIAVNDRFSSLSASTDTLPIRAPGPLAPMCVQYTSGTTARPKAVLWTHANALWGAKINAVHHALRPDDRYLCYLPLFHANALAYTMLASMWVGAQFVLIPRWSTSRFWDISIRYGCTWVNLIPCRPRRSSSCLGPTATTTGSSDPARATWLGTRSWESRASVGGE